MIDAVEMDARLRVVDLAKTWIGTPYVHEGRIKGACADCTFFAKVFEEAGMIPAVDIPHYGPQAHINRQASAYMLLVQRYAQREVKEADAMAGDIVMFRIGRTFSHGAVVVSWPQVIHADMTVGKVCMAEGDQGRLAGHERRFFSFW